MNALNERPVPDKSQEYYGVVVHWITIISCLIVLAAPVFIIMLPDKNLLNPNLIFDAIFAGKNPAEIWEAAGVPFRVGGFWNLFWNNLFKPDGIALAGIVLGCSVTLWALIPAILQLLKKREYLYAGISLFVAGLIALAMSGVINMAG